MGVKIMVLKIGQVRWAFSEETGAIPFIVNERNTRVKQLDDGFVLEILDRNKNSNPAIAGLNTLSDYYGTEMQFVNFADMLAEVSFFQKVQQFGLKKAGYNLPVDMDQIKFLTENYDRAMSVERKRRATQEELDREYEEAYVKTFNF